MFDLETKQRALQSLHIYCSDVRSHSSASESNKQNPRDTTLDLPSFFRYKHRPSLKNLPSPAPNESSSYWFQGNFAASFVLNFCLREFLLSAFANRFELWCQPKRLMLLYYKICPCWTEHDGEVCVMMHRNLYKMETTKNNNNYRSQPSDLFLLGEQKDRPCV